MANILITTTPILDKIDILRYIGPLTVNLVIGVNFFSDFAASFTDIFGGNSETYQSKLDGLTNEVYKLINVKASRIGANAVIDYKLQFNEISGKGKQMFMVSATGTACFIKMPKQEEVVLINQVSYSQIRRQYLINLYNQVLSEHKKIYDKDWENILAFNLSEIMPELTNEYFYVLRNAGAGINELDYKNNYTPKYEEFISKIDKLTVEENLYPFLDSNSKIVLPLFEKLNIFSPKEVLKQLEKGNIELAINLLKCHKDYYTKEDLSQMLEIIQFLENLPNKGSIQTVNTGSIFKKEEKVFFCPRGHKNSADQVYCTNTDCCQNIKGLTIQQVKVITKFKKFTESLASILK